LGLTFLYTEKENMKKSTPAIWILQTWKGRVPKISISDATALPVLATAQLRLYNSITNVTTFCATFYDITGVNVLSESPPTGDNDSMDVI
jgi:hypothetical protein